MTNVLQFNPRLLPVPIKYEPIPMECALTYHAIFGINPWSSHVLRDGDIFAINTPVDTSDIPEADEEWFRTAKLRPPNTYPHFNPESLSFAASYASEDDLRRLDDIVTTCIWWGVILTWAVVCGIIIAGGF